MNDRTPGPAYSADDDYNHLYKIVLVGDAGVGKTHLLNRYIKGTLPKNNVPTIGVEFATKTVTLGTGGKVKAQIWDTAGQERYRAITSAHYRRAVGALLVYDVTKDKTFESVTKWMEELKYHAEPDIVIMLVGNKVDLCDKNPGMRKVRKEEAQRFADEHKLLFEEASAVTSQNVNDVFEKLLQEIFETRNKKDSGYTAGGTSNGIKITKVRSGAPGEDGQKKGGCC
jgi:Rab family protein